MANVTPITAAQPIAQPRNDGALAPWPSIDKTGTIVIGPGLSLSYISSIFRLCLTGYRQNYVDLLNELLEKDPGSFSVISKRVLAVGGGRIELTPAKAEAGSLEEKLAQEICDRCTEMLDGLDDLDAHLTSLAWATYYSIVGLETHWQRDGASWFPERLSLIHSRRLAYPVSGSWDLFIWDQGQVMTSFGIAPTNRYSGLRVADKPGKFIVHAPQVRGDYPTREGLGRQLAYWMALKLVASRGAPQYLERFANPWPEAEYSTGPDNQRREASKEDIQAAKAALAAMGAGRLSSWVHPDTIRMPDRKSDGDGSKLTFAEWISICNAEISKATLGGTLTTEVGSTGGNRALGETQKKSELSLYKHDGKLLAGSVKRDLVTWMVRLNFPNAPKRLVPTVTIHVEDPPDPALIIDRSAKAAAAGIPVDADRVAEQANVPVIKAGDTKARRMFPILAQKDPAEFDADLAARRAELAPQEPDEPADGGGDPASDDTNDQGDTPDEEE